MTTIRELEYNLDHLRIMRKFTHADDIPALEVEILEAQNQLAKAKAERDRLPPSRAHAKAMRKSYYFDGIPCPMGHIAKKRTSNYSCMRCKKISDMERRRDKVKAKKEAQNDN